MNLLPSMLYNFLCVAEGDAGTTFISNGLDRSCGAKYDVLYSSLMPVLVARVAIGPEEDLRLSYVVVRLGPANVPLDVLFLMWVSVRYIRFKDVLQAYSMLMMFVYTIIILCMYF